ncbi:MAG: tRNA (adenosine(37)-N6)-threonylcarbamoyltransferase complex ATPase subunit type 1 TsaE [Candidatus Pacebacteria bacterium]|nr:tRNA (adenosine(37)-N6)-threonylcarbamoyltransferase complex ATPase subunit type 1 TsaE [Candidatus Paceibacterota bacterium]
MIKIVSVSSKETQNIGRDLAENLLKKKLKSNATVISLEGDFGGGKTTFTKGFARGLNLKEKIKSPTFVIMRKYRIPINNKQQTTDIKRRNNCRLKVENCKFRYFFHLDCYRIQNPKEILALGWKDIVKFPENIVLVEWGDKIKKILPRGTIYIKFDFINDKKRKIRMVNL